MSVVLQLAFARANATLARVPDIVLTTLNAKYIHAAFGLRYLMANLGALKERACLVEFDINQKPLDVAEIILARNPKIVGLGVYIWNVTPATELVAALKRIRPDLCVIIGGPEVSFETDQQEITRLADYVITGEADLKFAEVCQQILSGNAPPQKIIPAELPELAKLTLPYELYNNDDVAHRVIYVEASRGCPFTCEFCLSSLDIPVRQFDIDLLLVEMQKLLDRGVQQFKFVDRTFNLNINTGRRILEFFLERYRPGLFVHFEMIPDRLPEALRTIIAKYPQGALQFEVGIQTFNPEVAKHISRRNDFTRTADNFCFLREHTGVHIHADLIVGLPGESLESFANGFDRLLAMRPQEIQVGILKRLRGTPIVRHDKEWQMVYSANAPYEILQNKQLDFATMQRFRRFAKYWDLVSNSGNFVETAPLLWSNNTSAFDAFLKFSDWLYSKVRRQHSIALANLAELLLNYLAGECGLPAKQVAESLWRDWQRSGRVDRPPFLAEFITEPRAQTANLRLGPTRQARHLST